MSDNDSLDLTADDLLLDDDSSKISTVDTPKKESKQELVEDEKIEVSEPVETNTREGIIKPEAIKHTSTPVTHREENLEERIAEDLKVAFPGKGILEVTPSGFGFLRPKFTQSPDDIYVSQSQIRKFWLRVGDEVEGLIRPPKENEKFHGLLKIEKINGTTFSADDSRKRSRFNDLTSMYPDKTIKLETTPEVLSTRIMDLLSPIGFGQRALIVSPPKAGKTTLLKNIANAITTNHSDVHLMGILIGERPEEVTDLRRSIKAEIVSSHFDQSPRDQIRAAEIGLARAKRLVEMGQHVVILLDSITRLARAYNLSVSSSGRTLSGGFDPAALYPAKKFLGAARNCEEGGSLTIIGTALINTESRMDDLIYEEFKGTGNAEVHLDRKYADKRIYPAIDVQKSGTRQDALLIDEATMNKVTTLRRMLALLDDEERLTALIEKLSKTKNNAEFLESFGTNGK
ncbi:transcription termination factor Rho [Candidatus Roizmanbacteria bacterium RIFCSPHIGHO2_01_FULL_39_12b]|uniref:Transcription termination factor Rho n=1 Tax=Candidatus Roizmanbacteria bacterium RIFCSPHIGHO2_01_FULL_39_12b TaxID=1802030 RepID=A0A1F7GAQ3_9BACT|nr:MAG: transcription termination factor Rho [Candidatus Roizmanbacteria bacterium RIFCSPHIGHO2_01_FULL_39_12b]